MSRWWRGSAGGYSNFVRATFEPDSRRDIGDVVAYHATYYTNPVKPMPPENTRPVG